MTAIGFVTSKAPKGGYSLSRITGMEDGQVQTEVVAYTSSLVEAQSIEHEEKRQMFGEPAWYHAPPQHQRQVQPLMPASSVMPPAAPDFVDDGESLPKVANDYRERGGATGQLYDRLNGVVRAFLPAMFLAGCWLLANARLVV